MEETFVKLLDKEGHRIGTLRYKANLSDNLGITKRKTGEYALIHGSSDDAYAILVSDEEALEAIVASGKTHLLKQQRYDRLAKMFKPILIENAYQTTSVKKIRLIRRGYFIPISMQEMDLLDLQKGDLVEVTLRKTIEE